jgi:hypothetical protein
MILLGMVTSGQLPESILVLSKFAQTRLLAQREIETVSKRKTKRDCGICI